MHMILKVRTIQKVYTVPLPLILLYLSHHPPFSHLRHRRGEPPDRQSVLLVSDSSFLCFFCTKEQVLYILFSFPSSLDEK